MPSKYSKTALTFFVTMNNKTRLNGPRHSAEIDGRQKKMKFKISASALDRNEEMIHMKIMVKAFA
jgi:hypothetical protein